MWIIHLFFLVSGFRVRRCCRVHSDCLSSSLSLASTSWLCTVWLVGWEPAGSTEPKKSEQNWQRENENVMNNSWSDMHVFLKYNNVVKPSYWGVSRLAPPPPLRWAEGFCDWWRKFAVEVEVCGTAQRYHWSPWRWDTSLCHRTWSHRLGVQVQGGAWETVRKRAWAKLYINKNVCN